MADQNQPNQKPTTAQPVVKIISLSIPAGFLRAGEKIMERKLQEQQQPPASKK